MTVSGTQIREGAKATLGDPTDQGQRQKNAFAARLSGTGRAAVCWDVYGVDVKCTVVTTTDGLSYQVGPTFVASST